jgi:hypothetical protein
MTPLRSRMELPDAPSKLDTRRCPWCGGFDGSEEYDGDLWHSMCSESFLNDKIFDDCEDSGDE